MKNKVYLSALFVFATFCFYAQTVLYTNNFQNPSSFTINNGGNSTNNWLINSVYVGGGFVGVPTVPSQPASFSNPNGNYLHPRCVSLGGFIPQNANYLIPFGNTISAYMNTSIDASNYSDVTLTFWRTGGANGLSVVYSLDGGSTWQTAVSSVAGSPTTWQEVSYTINALDGQSNVRIGFRLSNSVTDPAPNHYHSIDEIKITGIESASCETVFGVDKIESCGEITWIDGNTYSSNNYTATHLLEGASVDGCDSLVTLNLTLWPCIELHPLSCGATVNPTELVYAVDLFAPEYRFRITGANDGGPGWNANEFVVDRPIRSFKFGTHIPGFVLASTYIVEVAVGDGMGNFGPYGFPCNVTLIANIPTVQLMNISCGATVETNQLVYAPFAGAMTYRFKIMGANTGAAGWNANEYILDRPIRTFKFGEDVPGIVLGSTYSIEVALSYDNMTYGAYGAACDVSLSTTGLHPVSCGATVDANQLVFATNENAVVYRFRINGVNTGAAGWNGNEFILDRPIRSFRFATEVPGHIASETYTVEVATSYGNDVFSAYGAVCDVTIDGVPELVLNNDEEMSIDNRSTVEVAFGANASHNPFTAEFGLQVLNANDHEPISISIYDMSGKLIERHALNPMDIENVKFGSNLASGMYMIEVRQRTNQAVIRQMKN